MEQVDAKHGKYVSRRRSQRKQRREGLSSIGSLLIIPVTVVVSPDWTPTFVISTCPACAFDAARSAAVNAKAKTLIRIFLPFFIARLWRRDFCCCSQSLSVFCLFVFLSLLCGFAAGKPKELSLVVF
jgi:hypothetical protein